MSPTPTFCIAGAARSGSTALAEALRAHPDAFISQPKEPHYFAFAGKQVRFTGPGDDATINRLAVTDRDAYLALYAGGEHKTARGEGSVSTLYYHERAIPAIHDVNPRMRVVIILRDPVDRAFSSFQYLRVRGMEPQESFLAAVAAEQERRAAGWHHLWHYTAMSMYAESVRAFLDGFPHGQVGVWFYDDLVSRPQQVVREVSAFVGLDPDRAAGTEPERVNVSGQPRRPWLQDLIGWAGRHEALRSNLKRLVPFAVRERIRAANLAPQEATADERGELAPAFTADLVELRRLVDGSTPPWLRA